jgi:hypothetical protein
MIDYSFLRLKTSFTEAVNTQPVPVTEFYAGNVHLIPNETYFQITNSETSIYTGNDMEVYLIDDCQTELEDITNYVFIEPFTDDNGISQISWELVNSFEYGYKPLSLKFVNPNNQDTWYTNFFVSTALNSDKTFRLDYKSSRTHYGTQYVRAPYYQAIRLEGYFNNKLNQSERNEYHQISTDLTVHARNVKKIKCRYVLEDYDEFITERLESAIINQTVYIDGVRCYSSDPIEFAEREGDSNISEQEMLLSKNLSDTFIYSFQIFDGIQVISYTPFGNYITGTIFTKYVLGFNVPITVNTGNAYYYNTAGLQEIYTESVMTVANNTELRIDVQSTSGENPIDDDHHVLVDSGLITFGGATWGGISDVSQWIFTLGAADYDSADYDSNDYFTN